VELQVGLEIVLDALSENVLVIQHINALSENSSRHSARSQKSKEKSVR